LVDLNGLKNHRYSVSLLVNCNQLEIGLINWLQNSGQILAIAFNNLKIVNNYPPNYDPALQTSCLQGIFFIASGLKFGQTIP
jgi:hypothetical protein